MPLWRGLELKCIAQTWNVLPFGTRLLFELKIVEEFLLLVPCHLPRHHATRWRHWRHLHLTLTKLSLLRWGTTLEFSKPPISYSSNKPGSFPERDLSIPGLSQDDVIRQFHHVISSKSAWITLCILQRPVTRICIRSSSGYPSTGQFDVHTHVSESNDFWSAVENLGDTMRPYQNRFHRNPKPEAVAPNQAGNKS